MEMRRVLIENCSLINELGAGERLSLAKFCVRFLAGHSRPPRIAIDVSIWIFQAQAGRGGANPELRTLFYRLARLVALPVHPLFVFDGPERPAYKRGKLIQRSGNAAGYVISLAKRLIELFRFPWHAAPGEAEAECAKLQTEGVVDAVMSDDVDAIMFGSTVTMRNFSRDTRGTGAATHINVCRTTNTADGEANVSLDQGGMILFALLSGGDYLPAGVPRCGPKLAGEIARAQFGTDLLEIIRENASNMDQKLSEWRERLQYELHTNESGYFRCKHKAIQIPEDFPNSGVLFDYVCPLTSSRSELKRACSSWVWDRDLNIQELRTFICEELNWNYSLGAKRLIRTVAPQLVAQRLRLGLPIVPGNKGVQISNRRENFGLDGMPELKIQFVPADVVELDWQSEQLPLSSERSETSDEDSESEAVPEDNEGTGISKKRQYHLYDPKQPDAAWILECLVTQGLPDMVAEWHSEQAKKKAKKEARVSKKKTTTRRKGPKVLDPSMKPGAILKFGTIVKGPAGSSNPSSPQTTPVSSGNPLDSYAISPGASQLSNAHSAYSLTTKTGTSDLTSSDIEAAFNYNFSEDGILPPFSPLPEFKDPNELHSFARYIDKLETSLEQLELSPTGNDVEVPSKSKPSDCPSPAQERHLRSRKAKITPNKTDVKVGIKALSIADKPHPSAGDDGTSAGSSRATRSSARGESTGQPLALGERSRRSRKPEGSDITTAEHSQPKFSTGDTKFKSRKSGKAASKVNLGTPPSTTGEQPTRSRKVGSASQDMPSNGRQTKPQKTNLSQKEDGVTVIDLCETLSTTHLSNANTIPQEARPLKDPVAKDSDSRKCTDSWEAVCHGKTNRRLSGVIETKNGTWTYRPKKDGDEGTNTPASSQANSKKLGKPKRLARVSILDLT